MNIDGYQHYLTQIGKWDSISGNEIQKLLRLEKDLDIDLDDFIRYEGNYSIVETLDNMMTEDMRYNEPLQFAINRYMVYKLSETDK